VNREQTISGYFTAFGETAGNPAAHNELQRRLVLTDLFFLLVFILDRKDINHDWLYARCREVEAAPDGYLDLWGREHRKSTIITFGKTIQDILRDPEITVGIFSFNRPSANRPIADPRRRRKRRRPMPHCNRCEGGSGRTQTLCGPPSITRRAGWRTTNGTL